MALKIDFKFTHPIYGIYQDALVLPDDHSYTDDEINALKQQRFDNWVVYLETPAPEQPIVEEPVAGE